jgi:hypothetical protein
MRSGASALRFCVVVESHTRHSVCNHSLYSIDCVYVRLAGVSGGKIVVFALIPPYGVDTAQFKRDVLVPELSKLVQGIRVRYRGTAFVLL